MKVSVIVPVYNESGTVIELLRRVNAVDLDKEVIVVDDGSTDTTAEILRSSDGLADKILFTEKNRGKGHAVRTGLAEASGDITIIQDADLEYDPQEYHKLLRPILEGEADVVYGNRICNYGLRDFHGIYKLYYIGNRVLTHLTNLLFRTDFGDMETCYKVARTSLFKQLDLRANRFDIEPEMSARIAKMRCKVVQVPISYNPRSIPEGKKIGWRDAISAVRVLVRERLTPSRTSDAQEKAPLE
jgi:glycosyltransferase involved in cell wall biosynthesis